MIGVDYVGFLYVCNNKIEIFKCYVCLFICVVIWVVYLEFVEDNIVNVFFKVFIRFISRRGVLECIIFDNV